MNFSTKTNIEKDLNRSNRKNQKHSYFSVSPVLTPSMLKEAHEGLQSSIHHSSLERGKQRKDFDESVEPVIHHLEPHYNRLTFENNSNNFHNFKYESNEKVNRQSNAENAKKVSSSKELLFQKAEPGSQLFQYPLSHSTYEQGDNLKFFKRYSENPSYHIRPFSEEAHVNQKGLEEVVSHLEIHNQNMMMETRQTVEDYEMYIEQLLESNSKMEEHLVEYENFLELAENEKFDSLENQKKREMILEKTLKEKVTLEKQIQEIKELKSQSPPTLPEHMKVKEKNEELENIKEELKKKQEMVNMLEDLVEEKEGVIKKMATFNNEMCLEIMEYKNKRNEALLISSRAETEVTEGKERNSKKMIKELENKIEFLNREREDLKEENLNLREEIGNILTNNESATLFQQTQNQKIKTLEQKLSVMETPKSTNHELVSKNSKTNYAHEELKSSTEKAEWDEDLDNGEILKKIDYLLKCLYNRLKDNGKKKQYKQTILSIMRTLTEINDEATDAELSRSQSLNSKNSNTFSDLDDRNENRLSLMLESDNMDSIIEKNENIFHKIKQIKRKMKNEAMSRGQSDQSEQKESDYNDDYDYDYANDEDALKGATKGSAGKGKDKIEGFELIKNGGRNKKFEANKFEEENKVFEEASPGYLFKANHI